AVVHFGKVSGHLWLLFSWFASESIAMGSVAPGAQRGHLPDRLDRDPRAHLRRSLGAVAENDRNFLDAESGLDRAVRELDLEPVAVGVGVLVVDPLERAPVEALEAAGEVAHGHPEHDPRVPGATARERPPEESPVGHAAAADVARAEHEVGLRARVDQPR